MTKVKFEVKKSNYENFIALKLEEDQKKLDPELALLPIQSLDQAEKSQKKAIKIKLFTNG